MCLLAFDIKMKLDADITEVVLSLPDEAKKAFGRILKHYTIMLEEIERDRRVLLRHIKRKSK